MEVCVVFNVEISEDNFLPSIKDGLNDEIIQFLTNHLIRSTAIREQQNKNPGSLFRGSLSQLEMELLIYYYKEGRFLQAHLDRINDRVEAEKKIQNNPRRLQTFLPVSYTQIPPHLKTRTIDVQKIESDTKTDAEELHTTAELKSVKLQEKGSSIVWEFTLEEFEQIEDIFSVSNQNLPSERIGEKIKVLSLLLNVSELSTEQELTTSGKRDTLTTKRLFENHSVTMLKRDLLDLLKKKYQLPVNFDVSSIMPFNIFITCKGHAEKNITLRDEVIKLLQHWLDAVLAERAASNAPTKPVRHLSTSEIAEATERPDNPATNN